MGGNPIVAQLAGAYQQAQQQEQQYSRMAAAAANTPYGKIYEQRAQAATSEKDMLYKEGLRLAEEAQKQEQGRLRPMTQGEANAVGLDSPAGYMMNPTTGVPTKVAEKKDEPVTWGAPTPEQAARLPNGGAGFQVSSKGEVKPIKEQQEPQLIQEYQYDQKDRAARGLPQQSFSEFKNTAATRAAGGAELNDKEGKPIDPSAPPEEILGQLDPKIAAKTQGYLEGRFPFPGTYAQKDPVVKQAVTAAQLIDPNYSALKYENMKKIQLDEANPKGVLGGANVAMNKVMHHSATLADSALTLANGDNPVANAIQNKAAQYGIGDSDKARLEAIRDFNLGKDAVANEAGKAFHGGGTTALGEVNRQLENININDPTSVQVAAINKLQDYIHGQLETNEQIYKEGVGTYGVKAWEKTHGRDFGFVQPQAQADLEHVGEVYAKLHGGGSPPAGGPVPGPGGPAPAPSTAPPPAPAGGASLSSPLDLANPYRHAAPTGVAPAPSLGNLYGNIGQPEPFIQRHPNLVRALGAGLITAPVAGPAAVSTVGMLGRGALKAAAPTAGASYFIDKLIDKLSGK